MRGTIAPTGPCFPEFSRPNVLNRRWLGPPEGAPYGQPFDRQGAHHPSIRQPFQETPMRRDTFLKSLAALAAAGSLPVSAQTAALKMMIPANPGGGWDTTGRALGKSMQEAGAASSVSYDNKGGAAGARVTYRLLLAGPQQQRGDDVKDYETWLRAHIEKNGVKGVRVDSLEAGRPEMRSTLERADRFLSLVGLLSAMLAAVAVAMAAR
eukprot:gene42098-52189_t